MIKKNEEKLVKAWETLSYNMAKDQNEAALYCETEEGYLFTTASRIRTIENRDNFEVAGDVWYRVDSIPTDASFIGNYYEPKSLPPVPEYQVAFTRISSNAKTGPIPVTTTEEGTCADSCPLKKNGCYADSGPLALFWRKVTERRAGMAWGDMLRHVAALPKGQLWRHNQAGDLAGMGDKIDRFALEQLVKANRGRRGFTYTHKPMSDPKNRAAVAEANRQGFTINLSANNLAEADQLAALGIGPVAVVVPIDQTTATQTPEGRKVAICPAAISESVSCATCGLCALRDRKAIIGFPAHGTSKRKAEAVAKGGI